SPQVKQQQANDFFFETSVSPKDKLIVQQQIQYTEKLYYAQNHQDAQLNEVKVTDARVQQLGETKNYTTVINGRRFGVYERTFAIYPEVSGELVIPGQRFNATVANPYDRWSRGRPISVVSKPIYLQIAPIPADYPQGSPWLVTPELSLEESYSNPSNQWKVGEAVTRIITIKAKGINASQLPQLALPQVDGLRTYADKNHSEDQHSSSGQIGISEQAIALVPSAAGEFTLPAIKVPWWNVQTQQIEYASLPAKHVQVQGAASASALSSAANANELTDSTSQNLVVAESSAQFTWLNGLMALLLLASVGLNLWLLTRQPKAKDSSKEQEKALSQKALWQQFSQACAQNNPQLIRQTLIQWANAGGLAWLNTPIHNLHQLVQQSSNQALNNALQELDQRLYSQHHNSAYNGQLLKRLVAQAQQSPQERTPSLYPL
ncbi:MAG: BatD family protein, partial [Venatoribacter sp.]